MLNFLGFTDSSFVRSTILKPLFILPGIESLPCTITVDSQTGFALLPLLVCCADVKFTLYV